MDGAWSKSLNIQLLINHPGARNQVHPMPPSVTWKTDFKAGQKEDRFPRGQREYVFVLWDGARPERALKKKSDSPRHKGQREQQYKSHRSSKTWGMFG
jgi:hypothetical protein